MNMLGESIAQVNVFLLNGNIEASLQHIGILDMLAPVAVMATHAMAASHLELGISST